MLLALATLGFAVAAVYILSTTQVWKSGAPVVACAVRRPRHDRNAHEIADWIREVSITWRGASVMKARNIMVMNVNTSPEVSVPQVANILFKTGSVLSRLSTDMESWSESSARAIWRGEPLEQRKSARHDEWFYDPEEVDGAVQIGAMEQACPFERDGPGWYSQIVGYCWFWGGEAEKEAARVAAEQVAGVRAIENNVIVQPAVGGA
jgi:hypothetical protein